MAGAVVELSHEITHGMTTYPGLPRPVIGLHTDHAASRPHYGGRAEFAIGRFELVGNVGTYLDSPYHRYVDGPDVSDIPLDRLVDLPVVVIDARTAAARRRRIDLSPAASQPLAGRAVLVRTGWDDRWGTDAYWEAGPYLGPTLVQQLLHGGPAVVGVDCWNVDDHLDPGRPVHTALLAAGIPVVEHLRRLGDVPEGGRLFVVPPAIRGAPSVPVRVFALAR
jgi:kynurenine formamidase